AARRSAVPPRARLHQARGNARPRSADARGADRCNRRVAGFEPQAAAEAHRWRSISTHGGGAVAEPERQELLRARYAVRFERWSVQRAWLREAHDRSLSP